MLHVVTWSNAIGLILSVILAIWTLCVGRNEGSFKRKISLGTAVIGSFILIVYFLWHYTVHSTYDFPFYVSSPNGLLQHLQNEETHILYILNIELAVSLLIQAVLFFILLAGISLIVENDVVTSLFCGITWSAGYVILALYYFSHLFFYDWETYPSSIVIVVIIIYLLCLLHSTVQVVTYRHNTKRYARILSHCVLIAGWLNSILWIVWSVYCYYNAYDFVPTTLINLYTWFSILKTLAMYIILLEMLLCLYLPEKAFERNTKVIMYQR